MIHSLWISAQQSCCSSLIVNFGLFTGKWSYLRSSKQSILLSSEVAYSRMRFCSQYKYLFTDVSSRCVLVVWKMLKLREIRALTNILAGNKNEKKNLNHKITSLLTPCTYSFKIRLIYILLYCMYFFVLFLNLIISLWPDSSLNCTIKFGKNAFPLLTFLNKIMLTGDLSRVYPPLYLCAVWHG